MKKTQYSEVKEYIESVTPIENQDCSKIYFFSNGDTAFAYKEYIVTDRFSYSQTQEMGEYLKKLFILEDDDSYSKFQLFVSLPRVLVYDGDVFKGFIMDRIPDIGYYDRINRFGKAVKQEGTLSWFWNGKIDSFSKQALSNFVKRLLRAVTILHKRGYILGDAISDRNLIALSENGDLFPYFIDADSFRMKELNPTDIYNSPGYIPPEGSLSISTKKTDVYKLCLVILRIFGRSNTETARVSMTLQDNAAAFDSLSRISQSFNSDFAELIKKGLSENPKERPSVEELCNAAINTEIKEPERTNKDIYSLRGEFQSLLKEHTSTTSVDNVAISTFKKADKVVGEPSKASNINGNREKNRILNNPTKISDEQKRSYKRKAYPRHTRASDLLRLKRFKILSLIQAIVLLYIIGYFTGVNSSQSTLTLFLSRPLVIIILSSVVALINHTSIALENAYWASSSLDYTEEHFTIWNAIGPFLTIVSIVTSLYNIPTGLKCALIVLTLIGFLLQMFVTGNTLLGSLGVFFKLTDGVWGGLMLLLAGWCSVMLLCSMNTIDEAGGLISLVESIYN